jgi:hypothetical protein
VRSAGDIALQATIRGGNTGIYLPYGIALDSNGNIYALSADPYDYTFIDDQVSTFPPDTKGDVAPALTLYIGGPLTSLHDPVALALTPASAQ